jgi:hypothetical protein
MEFTDQSRFVRDKVQKEIAEIEKRTENVELQE